MFDEQREARERLGAAVAGVLLELGVRLQVCAQVRPVGERAAALRARERPLAGVRAHVALQQPRPRERLVARRAAVLEVVRQQVHRQRRHRDVDLAAVRARTRVLAVDAAVRLLVAGQVRRRRVAPVALVARVLGPRRRSRRHCRCRRRRTDRRRRRRRRRRAAAAPPASVAAVDERRAVSRRRRQVLRTDSQIHLVAVVLRRRRRLVDGRNAAVWTAAGVPLAVLGVPDGQAWSRLLLLRHRGNVISGTVDC